LVAKWAIYIHYVRSALLPQFFLPAIQAAVPSLDGCWRSLCYMNTLAVVALCCATALTLTAQTKTLVLKTRVPSGVTFAGPRNFALPTACDERGRLYVKLVEPGPGMLGPLYRLSATGVIEAQFDTSGALMNRYAVRPNGGVVMVRQDGTTKFVDNFAPDGKHESAVRLDPPPTPFFPDQIAVFRSGEIFLSGPQYHPGNKASTAIYSSTGRLVKQFVLEGDDGLVYLMRATSPARVYAIPATGEVVRKIVISAPTDTGVPDFGFRIVKNRMAVRFTRSCENRSSRSRCEGTLYAVLDAVTGQRLATYEADKAFAGPLACYAPDPDRFLIFSMPTGNSLELVEAEPR